ncbi:unnamed protein product, partial [Brassica rapa subsp. trilocularis]
ILRSYAARRSQTSTETLISLTLSFVFFAHFQSAQMRSRIYVLKSVTEDIKEKIPYVANKYTAAWMLDVSGSFSPCRRHFMLLKLKSARLKNMKNYNNYLEEGRSEDEAVQLYFQRLTMTTMLRMVVKRSTQGFQNITDKFMELSTNSKIYLLSFVVLLEDQEVNKMMLFIGVM